MDPGNMLVTTPKRLRQGMSCWGVMKSPSSSQAARWAFDNLSLELQKTTEEDNFTEELEEFLKIMDNDDVDEEAFYKYLEFEHEDEDYAMSTPARNKCIHVYRSRVFRFRARA